VHAQTVDTKLSFPPPQIKSLGTRLWVDQRSTVFCYSCDGICASVLRLSRGWIW